MTSIDEWKQRRALAQNMARRCLQLAHALARLSALDAAAPELAAELVRESGLLAGVLQDLREPGHFLIEGHGTFSHTQVRRP